MAKEFYEIHNYLNRDIPFLGNVSIKEYDMKAGGFSILKAAGVFSQADEQYLSAAGKEERNIIIGNMVKADGKLGELLLNGFAQARKELYQRNNVMIEDILSVKKDAVYIINRSLDQLEFSGFTFELRNSYSSFFLLNKREFYFSGRHDRLDVKGLGKELVEAQEDYFLNDLKQFFAMSETAQNTTLMKHLRRYRNKYLNLDLPIPTYRELSLAGGFRMKARGEAIGEVYLDSVDSLDGVETGYNFLRYVVPFIQLVM